MADWQCFPDLCPPPRANPYDVGIDGSRSWFSSDHLVTNSDPAGDPGDFGFFQNVPYVSSALSTLSSPSVGTFPALQSCAERITDIETPRPPTIGVSGRNRSENSSTIEHKGPTERNDGRDLPRANDFVDKAAYNTTFSASFPSSIAGSVPMSEASTIPFECPVAPQPDMTVATHCSHNALSPITSGENTTCKNISRESIEKEDIACGVSAVLPRICPPGYEKRLFPDEMAERLIRDYNLPQHHVYYYWRYEDCDDHTCPLDCGQQFVGKSIKDHLGKFHPNINSRSRRDICCSTQSHLKSKCPPQNVVQERYFLKHFTVMHSLAHSLCPFCLRRQTRVDHLYRHFAVCKVLRPKSPA